MGQQKPSIMQLSYYQTVVDSNFGDINIYRSPDSRYFMQHTRTFIQNDKMCNQFQKILDFTNLQCTQNTSVLVPIQHIKQQQITNICLQYHQVTFYNQYFNFTLYDMLQTNKLLDETQLWYCLKEMTALAIKLKLHGLIFQFPLDRLFVNLAGGLAIYSIFFTALDPNEGLFISQDTTPEPSMPQHIVHSMLQLINHRKKNLASQSVPDLPLLSDLLQSINQGMPLENVLEQLQTMQKQGTIRIAIEIRVNKFKYVLHENGKQIIQSPNFIGTQSKDSMKSSAGSSIKSVDKSKAQASSTSIKHLGGSQKRMNSAKDASGGHSVLHSQIHDIANRVDLRIRSNYQSNNRSDFQSKLRSKLDLEALSIRTVKNNNQIGKFSTEGIFAEMERRKKLNEKLNIDITQKKMRSQKLSQHIDQIVNNQKDHEFAKKQPYLKKETYIKKDLAIARKDSNCQSKKDTVEEQKQEFGENYKECADATKECSQMDKQNLKCNIKIQEKDVQSERKTQGEKQEPRKVPKKVVKSKAQQGNKIGESKRTSSKSITTFQQLKENYIKMKEENVFTKEAVLKQD